MSHKRPSPGTFRVEEGEVMRWIRVVVVPVEQPPMVQEWQLCGDRGGFVDHIGRVLGGAATVFSMHRGMELWACEGGPLNESAVAVSFAFDKPACACGVAVLTGGRHARGAVRSLSDGQTEALMCLLGDGVGAGVSELHGYPRGNTPVTWEKQTRKIDDHGRS